MLGPAWGLAQPRLPNCNLYVRDHTKMHESDDNPMSWAHGWVGLLQTMIAQHMEVSIPKGYTTVNPKP